MKSERQKYPGTDLGKLGSKQRECIDQWVTTPQVQLLTKNVLLDFLLLFVVLSSLGSVSTNGRAEDSFPFVICFN